MIIILLITLYTFPEYLQVAKGMSPSHWLVYTHLICDFSNNSKFSDVKDVL